MKRNRLFLMLSIIAAIVFTGFFGGTFSYAILYAILLIPLASLFYTAYVYFRFRVYQVIATSTMTKGEEVSYTYILSNEDILYYKSLKIRFTLEYSQVEVDDFREQVSLLPGEKHERSGRLVCLYRGEYKVGIESVEVEDLLGLFSLKMGRPSTITARVYPRIMKLSSLPALNISEDTKSLPFLLLQKNELPDSDSRLYAPGDDPKHVNWKVSAKYQELYVRRYTKIPKEKIRIYLDASSILGEQGDRIILEDALLEVALAILDFYLNEKIEAEILYYTDRRYYYSIKSKEDFQLFYKTTALMKFNGETSLGEFIRTNEYREGAGDTLVAVTTLCDDLLVQALSTFVDSNRCVLLVGDKEGHELKEIREKLGKVKLVNLPQSGNITKILEKE